MTCGIQQVERYWKAKIEVSDRRDTALNFIEGPFFFTHLILQMTVSLQLWRYFPWGYFGPYTQPRWKFWPWQSHLSIYHISSIAPIRLQDWTPPCWYFWRQWCREFVWASVHGGWTPHRSWNYGTVEEFCCSLLGISTLRVYFFNILRIEFKNTKLIYVTTGR